METYKTELFSALSVFAGWLIGRRREKSEIGKTDAEARQIDATTWQQRFDNQQKIIDSLQNDLFELHNQYLELHRQYIALATIAINHGWRLPTEVSPGAGQQDSPGNNQPHGNNESASRFNNRRSSRRQRRASDKNNVHTPGTGKPTSEADSGQD
jgi:hypothetical protein